MNVASKPRMLEKLRQAGYLGCHSHELRLSGVSSSPSQRAKDLRSDGWNIYKRRENRGKSPGVRFWIAPYQPANAELVTPNPEAGGGGGTPPRAVDAPAAASPSSGSVVGGGVGSQQAESGMAKARSGADQSPDEGGRLFSLPSPEPRGVADPEDEDWEAA